jgi:hypothetical protein
MAKTRRAYSGNAAATTISSGISAIDTSITITAATGWPSGAPFHVVLDPGTAAEEKILVTRSSTTLTVSGSRGADDTSASSHSAGAVIYPVFTAVDANEANLLASTLTTQGDMLYHGASDFARVAIGTAAQVLKVNAGATAPEWGQIATAGIADSAVTSAKIADGTIVAGDLADGAVTSAKILDGTIATGDIADGAITSAKILDGTIATGDLADSAVTSAKIADGTIVAGDLADGAVTSAKILDGTIVAGDIADGAVTSAKILDGTIVNADINASAAIALSKLATGALPTTITVASGNIVNGTITNTDISSSAAIESSKLKGNIYILTKSSAQSISNATDTNLTWASNTELGGLGYTLTSSTYVNIPRDGYYLLSAGATFGANGTGARRIRIWNYALNDILAEASTAGFTGIDNVLNCSCVAQLDASNQVYVEVYQSSGGSLNVKADKSTFFRVSMLAAYSV